MKVFYTKTADIIGYKVQSRLKNPKMPLYFAILTQITFQFDFLDSAYKIFFTFLPSSKSLLDIFFSVKQKL